MKKNKKIILIIAMVALVSLVILLFLLNIDRSDKLTLQENKWVDTHKHDIIDIAILNDIPIISYEGSGVVYNFLNEFKNEYSFDFNYVSYKLDDNIKHDYTVKIKDKPGKNDIIIYQDNLILVKTSNSSQNNSDTSLSTSDVSNEDNQISDTENIVDKIGIIKSDEELLNKYFDNSKNFIAFDTYGELKQAVIENKVNGVIVLKSLFMKEIVENDYAVESHYNDLTKYYVLSIKNNTDFLNILKKYYHKWSKVNFEKEYYSNMLANYYKFKKVNDITQKELNSKNYIFGFIDYGIYNYIYRNRISGLNSIILKEFNKFSGVPIKYIKYNSLNKLINEFNNQKVDFTLNIIPESSVKSNHKFSNNVFQKKLIIISGINNTKTIESLKSLQNKEVLVVKDSYVEELLLNVGSKIKLYNNFKDLTNEFNDNSIAIIDLENYNFYKSSAFKNCKINYIFDYAENYNYIVNDIKGNETFYDLFNFYLKFVSTNKLINKNYSQVSYRNTDVIFILILIILILCIYVFIDFTNHLHSMVKQFNKRKNIRLSKSDKIKYIDQLTSLKNRAYFNSKIEVWDEAEIYPKAIIIIDLNNISYINDNYGREEGDKVITEAANILMQNQLENSEIIRSDGNEFLIYLVGYNDKQIASYIRKLNKDLKGLSHGFGSAAGYSIIEDDLKTIDDAVNEATLDMKNNKEDIDY